MISKEKRSGGRVSFHAKASVHLEEQNVDGEVENVSLKGAFVAVNRQIRIHDVVAFTIHDTTTYRLKATVVRVTNKGIGLQFERTLLS
jgi:hypothetical protein